MSAVEHPSHYNNHPSGVECIDVVQHMNFNLGNAVKYIWRCDEKGNPIQDLEKAIFYLQQEIKRRRGVKPVFDGIAPADPADIKRYISDGGVMNVNLYNPVDFDKTVASYRRSLHDDVVRVMRGDPGGLY